MIESLRDIFGEDDDSGGLIDISQCADHKEFEVSETALRHTEWDLFRSMLLAEENPSMLEVMGKAWEEGMFPGVMADAFGVAYYPYPDVAESCIDDTRHNFIKDLLGSPQFSSVRHHTVCNEFASELVTMRVLEQLADLVEKENARKESAEKKKEEGCYRKEKDSKASSRNMATAVASAIESTRKEVEEYKAMSESMGLGSAPGGGCVSRERLKEYFSAVKNNERVKKIMEIAGRSFIFAAMECQKRKPVRIADDVVGTTMSGSVKDLLPSELALLGDPHMSLELIKRIDEKSAMCREYSGVKKIGKGPIIVTVDTSGSMNGDKLHCAKALALALAYIARRQKRWCALIDYSGGREGYMITLKPGDVGDAKLIDWLGHAYGGGTTLDVPLVELPGRYWKELKEDGLKDGETDVIIITDSIVHAPKKMIADFTDWKKEVRAKVISIIIGANSMGDVEKISDEVFNVTKIDIGSPAMERVLSI